MTKAPAILIDIKNRLVRGESISWIAQYYGIKEDQIRKIFKLNK